MSTTVNYIDAEIHKLEGYIEKTKREIRDLEKTILSKTQGIGKWEEMIVNLRADLDKLNG
jgi:peptidoglycan hydrolase CwlO-like protein